ncbi:hypothetical protein NYO98_14125 [Nocardioides sp. STR2]|uniref:DUF7144 domain-containing protein n=1 Tax=Nocardioides pini TaxID=2975053 RepID=A0ABT4CGA9_9ACTN|nr:hypothetical protein [Nocardioides pini]MCY4727421.1 hypothetical protein [Nocardioides pini]
MTSDTTRPQRQEPDERPASPLWTGMLGFASIMLLLLGGFHALGGFIALLENRVYDVNASDLLLFQSYRGWGIAHIAVGVLAFMTGIALFYRKPWSRVATIVLASLSALMNLTFLSASPVWYGLLIVLDILVLYAVTVHFDDELD